MSAELAQRLAGEWLVVSIWGEPVDPQPASSPTVEPGKEMHELSLRRAVER